MVPAVDAPAALPPGWRQEATLLVEPDLAHRGAGLAGQLVDAQLLGAPILGGGLGSVRLSHREPPYPS